MNKYNRGFASVILLAIAIVVLIVGIALYGYLQTGDNKDISESINNMVRYGQEEAPTNTPAPISESDDVDTLESELDATVVESPEDDLEDLEQGVEEL